MGLTEVERRFVERMRQRQLCWKRTRWLLLIGGSILGCVWASLFASSAKALDSVKSGVEAQVFTLVLPIAMAGMVFSGALIGLALKNWFGNPVHMLFLRLIDAQLRAEDEEPT
jgi:hypothetical protein